MTLTAVSKFTDVTSGGQHRLAIFDSVAVNAPLLSLGSVLCSLQISAQSLEAMAVIVAKSEWRISLNCMHAACKFKATRSPAHSDCRNSQRRLSRTLLYSSIDFWAYRSYKIRPFGYTAHVGCNLLPLSPRFHLHPAASFFH